MNTMRARLVTSSVLCASLLVLAPVSAAADPPSPVADYGAGCVLDAGNRAATIDSLRFRCSVGQQDQIYRDAGAGAVPMGVTNGWVVRPQRLDGVAQAVWIGKVFRTGPDGGTLTNRVTGAGFEAFPADIYRAPSILDGGQAWALNYPNPVYDEIREVTPGVWLGYSWWRGGDLIATFVLTPA